MSDLRMPDLNKVFVAGRLTRDPELKYTGAGRPYCRLGVANSRYYKSKDGERREETCFIDVALWGPSAEWVGEKLTKGRPVIVEGRLRTAEWEDRSSGQKRSKLEVDAQRVTPLDWDDNQGGGGRGGGGGYSGGGGGGGSSAPKPRPIEEPIPEDDIPF